MSEKRQPLLADRFAANRDRTMLLMAGEKATREVQHRVRQARKLVFDVEATERVASVVRDIPELILRESQFARAPFDLTWIEYDAAAYWETLMGHPQNPDDNTVDTRVGFLIDHNRVNVVMEGTSRETNGNGLYPIAYHLNTEWPAEDQRRFAEFTHTSRLGLDVWLWGSTAQHFMDTGQTGLMRTLRDHNMAEWIGNPAYTLNVRRTDLLGGAQGDLRTVIALLLMINRPAVVQYKHTLPNARGFIRNKLLPYLSHTVVSVSLDAVKTLRLIGTPEGEAIERRRHEVRGHYCHDHTAREYMRIAGCMHDWQPCDETWARSDAAPAEVNHWTCGTCGGKRWWRVAHERGSAERGFVAHDGYEITDRSER